MGGGIFWFVAGVGAAHWWSKWHTDRDRRREAYYAHYYGASPAAQTAPGVPAQHYPLPPPHQDAWDADRRRFMNSMADLSEATLDTLLVTAQAMRNKLAESRTRRDGYLSPVAQPHTVPQQPEVHVPQSPLGGVVPQQTKTD
ncbi:hypothetical protein HGRIS_004816 [Hohenbuehelia grisea]|uniref:Uncharacterized protein n=1 Tax=Hohenbuehelia grisea TaxID=104357 RepID=A0ABR3JDX2_9AGAR